MMSANGRALSRFLVYGSTELNFTSPVVKNSLLAKHSVRSSEDKRPETPCVKIHFYDQHFNTPWFGGNGILERDLTIVVGDPGESDSSEVALTEA